MKYSVFRNSFYWKVVFIVVPAMSMGQGHSSSPYSRFGIGSLTFQGTVSQYAMGRSGVASFSADRINILNPAAMAFDTITTIEAGLYAEVSEIKSAEYSHRANDAGMNYLAIGFPVVRHLAAAGFGVAPFSRMDFTASEIVNPDCQCGRTRNTYTGQGGINRFYLAMGIAPFGKKAAMFYSSDEYYRMLSENDQQGIEARVRKFRFFSGLSAGINASWLFGTLDYSRKVDFIDSTTFLNTIKTTSSTLQDLYMNVGLHYHFTTRQGVTAGLAFSFFPTTPIRSVFNSVWYNRLSPTLEKDTVEVITDQKGSTLLPRGYSAGIILARLPQWKFTADYNSQQWSRFQSDFTTAGLHDSYSIHAGIEIIPDHKSLSYFKKINYRAGLFYHSSALQFKETVIKDYGISFGFGLPVIKKDRIQRSMIQIGFEAGRLGTTRDNLVRQDYFRVHVGIVLNEFWFFKRHYE
jgi:hypothetical protein